MLVLAAPRALATPPSPRRGASSWRRGAPRLPPSAGTNDARGEPRPPREQPRSARRPVRPPLLSRRAPGGGAVRARASADERGDDREDDEDDEPVVVVHGVEYAVDDDPDIFAAEAEAEKKIKKPVDSGPDAGDGDGKNKPSEPSEPMTDDEALRAMEKIVRATMSSSAARTIARELVALGADTPARARRLLVGASANYILFELVAIAVNAAVAFGMYVLFQSAESYFFAAPPQGGGGPFAMDRILRTLAKFGPFALGGVFAIESLAHATIAGSMIATATFFGFADLDAFSAAVLKLGGGGGGKGGGEGGEGFRRVPSSIVPGVASVRDAATSLRVARRLPRLRAAVDAELRAKDAAIDVDSPGRSSVERLAAIFELTAAETERGFDPSAYGVSESEALRLAALFADFDDDGDGFVGAEELGRLLRELNRVAWEEDDARGGAEVSRNR